MDSETRQHFKTLLYEQFARIGKAFGNARRLEIIDLLVQSRHTVDDLARKTGLSVANVSQHLQILRSAKLVEVERVGTYAWYRLANQDVYQVWHVMREYALAQVSDIDALMRAYFEERYTLEEISPQELLQRIQNHEVIVLDVRPENEYRAGHIDGAVSIPLNELQERLAQLPKDSMIVAYCRASYCLLSDEAALFLREQGYNVRIYKDGFPQWQALGLPTASDEP